MIQRRGFLAAMLALGGATAVGAQGIPKNSKAGDVMYWNGSGWVNSPQDLQHPTEAQLNGMTEEECDCPTTNEPFQGEHEPDGTEIHPEDDEPCKHCPPDASGAWMVSCPVCLMYFDAHGSDTMTEDINDFAMVVCPAEGCGVFFCPTVDRPRDGTSRSKVTPTMMSEW